MAIISWESMRLEQEVRFLDSKVIIWNRGLEIASTIWIFSLLIVANSKEEREFLPRISELVEAGYPINGTAMFGCSGMLCEEDIAQT